MGVTLPPIALFWPHPEDLVALGAVQMLYGLAAAMDDRPRAAGWWLGTALAFQFFAVLAVPLALLLIPRLGAVVDDGHSPIGRAGMLHVGAVGQ